VAALSAGYINSLFDLPVRDVTESERGRANAHLTTREVAMRVSVRACVVVGILAIARPCFAWGDQGHQLVARIAARSVSSTVKRHIVAFLRKASPDDLDLQALIGKTGDPQPSLANFEAALAKMAIWPDHMPGGKGITAPWHFVDIALFEGPSHIAERCGTGGCVSEKIPILAETSRRTRNSW
jgi:hypothetical protein